MYAANIVCLNPASWLLYCNKGCLLLLLHLEVENQYINRPPADWRRRAGRPRRTWSRTIELDLRPHNIGLNTAWMRAQDRSKWRQLVETAMLNDGRATR